LDDVEVHTFEEICTQPATKVDPQDSSEVGRVVQEMIRFRDEYEVARCKNDHDLSAFWLRKTKKPVLSVLMVQKDGEEPKFYRGTNMEVRPVLQNSLLVNTDLHGWDVQVSMPTGSLCAERNVIGTALAADITLKRQDLKMIAVLSAGSIDDPPRQRVPIAAIKAEGSGSASQLVTVDHESHGHAAGNGGNVGLSTIPSPGGQLGLAIYCPEKTEGFNAPADGRPLTHSPTHTRKTKIFLTGSVNSGPNAPPSPRSPRSPVSERSASGNSATPHGTPEPLSRTPDLERGHLNNGNYSLGDSLEVEQFLLPPTAGPVPVPVPRFSALSSMKRPLSEASIGDGVVGGAGMGSDGNASCRKVRLVSSSRNVAVESPVPTPVAGTGAGAVADTASSGHGSGTATSDCVGTVTSRKSGTVTYAEDSDMFVDYSYHDSIGAYTDIVGFNICEPCRPSMLPLEETIEVDAKYVFSKFCELRICAHDFSVAFFFLNINTGTSTHSRYAGIAVLSLMTVLKLFTVLKPCGACHEWLKKIAEVNPQFTVM
jgi:cytidine deaminase